MRVLFVAIVVAAHSATALAGPSAEELYDQGQHAFDAGDYPRAIAKWKRSYELSSAPLLLFNVAQAYRLSGDCEHALASYKRFTEALATEIEPTSDQRAIADDFIHELQPKCGAPTRPPSGDHSSATPARTLKVAGFATGGAGVALVATGLLFGRRASSLGDEVTSDCAVSCDWATEKSKQSDGQRDATIGKVLDGVGLAAIAVGVGMYIYGSREGQPALAIQRGAHGATVTWSRAW